MEEKHIQVDGVEMFYRAWGEGMPLVCVHGNLGSGLWFSKVEPPKGYRIYAPDLPNFGKSGPIDTADLDRYADYLKGWIEALGLENPVILGHSLGGSVVVSLALRFPEIPKKLVLVDSAPLSGLKTPEEHYPVIEMYKTNRELVKQALGTLTPSLGDEGFLDDLTDEGMRMNPPAFEGNARALERFDYTGRGKDFTGEVLVVGGEKDLLINEAMVRATAEEFPGSRVEMVPGVGHAVMVEDPGLFTRLLSEFLG